ncbi:hypothetical protein Tco_1176501 [Tanacetum coccineum]
MFISQVYYSKHSRRKPKLFCDQSSKWSDRGRFAVVSESGRMVSKPDPRIHSDGFETSSRGNRLNRPLRSNNPRTSVRSNGSRYGERSHCSHNRSIDSYDPHACNCYQHNDYRAKEGNPERDTEVSKPYYRENKFSNQTEYVCDNYIRPKSNVTKKTWEPIESKKVGLVKHIDPLNGKSSVTTNHEHSDMKESENTVEIDVDTLSGTTDLSTSSNSSSDSCSSCLSEGDGGTSFSSSTQNPDSSSTSDSEDASHHSEVIKESPQNTKEDETLTEVSSGELPSKTAQFHENSPPQLNVVVPPLPAQGIHFPVYQAPSLGYYHPAPVPWVATAANGLMPVPHPNHYLFPSPFGYGLNGNSHFLQYGVSNLRPLGPPLFDHAQQPMYQSIPQVNGTIKDHTKVPVPQKGVQNENSEKARKSNTGFSLFHFGGPVAHSNGSIDVDATLSSKGLGDTIDGGAHACAKDVVEAEQYNLFSANNGIRFFVLKSCVKGRRGLVSPRKGRVPMSERVFNPTPITQFNPVTNEVLNDNVKLAVMTEDADIVKENPVIVNQKLAAVLKDPLRYSRSVKGKPASVINKLSLGKSNVPVAKDDVVKISVDKEALVDKASVLSVTKTNVLTQLETAPDVVNDKVSKESVLSTGNVDVVQVDPAKVVIQSVLTQLENAPDVENSAPDTDVIEIDKYKADVVKSSNVVVDKNVVADKVYVAKDVVQDDPAKVVKESVAKDKPKGSASSVVVNKDNREGVNDKVLGVVAKDKPKGSVSSVVVRKDNRKESSEKEALFQKKKKLNVVSKDKPKSKASELVKRKRKGGPDSDSNSADKEEHSKKKPNRKQKKLKAGLKRKTSGSDASDSSSN